MFPPAVLALPLIGRGTVAEVAVRGFYWWAWFLLAAGAYAFGGALVERAAEQRIRQPASDATFVRHVSLLPDGRGATYALREEGGRHHWSWSSDSDDVMRRLSLRATRGPPFNPVVDLAIIKMEAVLGLPPSYPPDHVWSREPMPTNLPGWPWDVG